VSETSIETNQNTEVPYEVQTNEAKVVGKSDPETGLEAVQIGCGLTVFVDKEKKIVGMIHSSMLIEEAKAEELVADIVWGFKSRGGGIKDTQITGILLSETNEKAIKSALKTVAKIDKDIPNNLLNSDGIRVNIYGEIKEFNFDHKQSL